MKQHTYALKNDSYLHVRAYGRFRKVSADGLSQVNKIDIHNLCHHCRILNIFYFRCVHHLVLFFISFSSPTFIIYLSLYLILWLSLLCISLPLSLQPRSLSLFRYVNHPHLFISLTLSLSSATLTHFTLFCSGCNLSVFLSPSLSFFPMLTVTFQTCTLSLSVFLMFSLFSPCSHAHLLCFLSRCFSFSISLPSSLSLYLSLYLSLPLSLSSAMLTHFTIFCCGRHLPPFLSLPFLSLPLSLTPPFSHSPFLSLPLSLTPAFSHSCFLSLPLSLFNHTHTHFTIFSYVNRHSSDTYTTPISLSLSLAVSLSPSLPPSLSLSLSLPTSLSLISHRMQ